MNLNVKWIQPIQHIKISSVRLKGHAVRLQYDKIQATKFQMSTNEKKLQHVDVIWGNYHAIVSTEFINWVGTFAVQFYIQPLQKGHVNILKFYSAIYFEYVQKIKSHVTNVLKKNHVYL